LKKSQFLVWLIILVLIIDQATKVYIKLNFPLYGGFNIFGLEWARIYFIENDGMAFGLKFGGDIGKYILSVFRIFMVGFLIYFLKTIIKSKEAYGLQVSFALIIAGAIGNIIDSAFYGLIFSNSSPHSRNIAEFMPEEGGYEGFLQGQVVDMFHFPMINSRFPEWLPIWGGDAFSFFRPVFNVADSSISIGVILILLFYRSFFIANKAEEGA
jgi:signal peptidase II